MSKRKIVVVISHPRSVTYVDKTYDSPHPLDYQDCRRP